MAEFINNLERAVPASVWEAIYDLIIKLENFIKWLINMTEEKGIFFLIGGFILVTVAVKIADLILSDIFSIISAWTKRWLRKRKKERDRKKIQKYIEKNYRNGIKL